MAPLRSQPRAPRMGGASNHHPNAVPLTVKGLLIAWIAAAAVYFCLGVLPVAAELFSVQIYSGLGQLAPVLILLMELIFTIVALVVALGIARRSTWAWKTNVYASITILVLALALPFLSFSADNPWPFFTFFVTLIISFYILLFTFRYSRTRQYLTARQRWLRQTIEQRH
jgi:hypothetical protein